VEPLAAYIKNAYHTKMTSWVIRVSHGHRCAVVLR
jgi:hypothetical protein